jgi:hypothetical protein
MLIAMTSAKFWLTLVALARNLGLIQLSLAGCTQSLTVINSSSWRRGMGILTLGADEKVSQVKVSKRALTVTLKDGRTIAVPLTWYPKLLKASPKQRNNWRVAGGGYGIHWPEIDKDLSTEGLLRGAPAPRGTGAMQSRPLKSKT